MQGDQLALEIASCFAANHCHHLRAARHFRKLNHICHFSFFAEPVSHVIVKSLDPFKSAQVLTQLLSEQNNVSSFCEDKYDQCLITAFC